MKFLVRAAAALGLVALLAGTANAMTPAEEKIAERIKPVGGVCVEGQDCGEFQPVAATAAPENAEPRTGEQVYNTVCSACHGTGAAGAPKFGDSAAWGPRIAQGIDTLVHHAVNGIRAMPPRGTCSNCSDEEISNAVHYMAEHSK